MSLNRSREKRDEYRNVLWDKQNGICFWCCRPLLVQVHPWKCSRVDATFEHIEDKVLNTHAPNRLSNLVLVHSRCNSVRNEMRQHYKKGKYEKVGQLLSKLVAEPKWIRVLTWAISSRRGQKQ